MSFEQIKLNNDPQIQIVQYENLYSNSFRNSDIYQWSDWLNKLQIPMIHTDKYKRGLVVYGDIADDKDKEGKKFKKYRKDENIINRSAIALDYDDIENTDNFKLLYQTMCKLLNGCAWVMHSTFKHTTEKPRVRVMIPLNETINSEEYRTYTKAIANYIGFKIDEGSFQPSRAMALPVKQSKDAAYLFKYNDQPAIKREHLDKILELMKEKESNKIIKVDYSKQQARRDSSYWRDIAFGVGEGERNQTLASLIGYLLRRYVDVNLVYGLALAWAEQCTPPINYKEVNNTFKSILKKDMNR
ncbi:primase alpha helix C-terminal domain-containing protein [Staphylococcus kloosii]|uniref:primase alpha helix C-terminal domain-containing protein n=1 Tax=Staphylococcus kloosii TaxID=29384 RepID=UPI001E35974E|nr:primase alpha helix C-terminal domain-containing protein [Staphylococcus kloosii]MCD8878087.1 primase alpha helix C-terminal domain-containing protein [Staphylococcus kloosii]